MRTLVSSGGTNIMRARSDADTLQQQNGTALRWPGRGTDHLVSVDGSQVTMSGGADADTLQQSGGGTIVLAGDEGPDLLTA